MDKIEIRLFPEEAEVVAALFAADASRPMVMVSAVADKLARINLARRASLAHDIRMRLPVETARDFVDREGDISNLTVRELIGRKGHADAEADGRAEYFRVTEQEDPRE